MKTDGMTPQMAYEYALNTVKGIWMDGEGVILRSPKFAWLYVSNIVNGRWEKGEKVLVSNKLYFDKYLQLMKEKGINVDALYEWQ